MKGWFSKNQFFSCEFQGKKSRQKINLLFFIFQIIWSVILVIGIWFVWINFIPSVLPWVPSRLYKSQNHNFPRWWSPLGEMLFLVCRFVPPIIGGLTISFIFDPSIFTRCVCLAQPLHFDLFVHWATFRYHLGMLVSWLWPSCFSILYVIIPDEDLCLTLSPMSVADPARKCW